MRIAQRFLRVAERHGYLPRTARIEVELQGALALTGIGHGTDKAVILGLLGYDPETIDPLRAEQAFSETLRQKILALWQGPIIRFDPLRDIRYKGDHIPDLHPNGMCLRLFDGHGTLLLEKVYYSTGGGFIASARQLTQAPVQDIVKAGQDVPYAYRSAAELMEMCDRNGLTIDEIVMANEQAWRTPDDTKRQTDQVIEVMLSCIARGLETDGELPGGLNVLRRAPGIYQKLRQGAGINETETLFDWLNVYAMAVNEENAAGGRVVTAPTNGAAGILPAILRHYCCDEQGQPRIRHAHRLLSVAGGIGLIYKQRASISGAEMGCQGEVGVACSMAAAGLAAVWGARPEQCLAAAEIAMEHNLGLTCDPVGGLVQIPCIERNAIGTVKAVNAARLALHQEGAGRVSLDQVIETMRQTGLDMSSKYKETSQGGLAVNVVAC